MQPSVYFGKSIVILGGDVSFASFDQILGLNLVVEHFAFAGEMLEPAHKKIECSAQDLEGDSVQLLRRFLQLLWVC